VVKKTRACGQLTQFKNICVGVRKEVGVKNLKPIVFWKSENGKIFFTSALERCGFTATSCEQWGHETAHFGQDSFDLRAVVENLLYKTLWVVQEFLNFGCPEQRPKVVGHDFNWQAWSISMGSFV
jgi:hypothetical protein